MGLIFGQWLETFWAHNGEKIGLLLEILMLVASDIQIYKKQIENFISTAEKLQVSFKG